MPPLLYQISGGLFFIPATLLLVLVVILRTFARRRWISLLVTTAAMLAVAAIVISATALPWWFYICWTVSVLAWFCAGLFKSRAWRIVVSVVLVVFSLSATGLEFSYQRLRAFAPSHFSKMYVLGDSLTAGLGRAGETTWPAILRAQRHIQIVDLSRAGCTVSQALKTAKATAFTDGIVLIEIGGNDIIGRTDARQFGDDLDQLVHDVQGENRSREVVMFELPLFPFDNAYGIEQRRAASKYGIHLIPRRFLTEILSSSGATVDGVHLSNTGQIALAALVWKVVGRGFLR